MTSTKAPVRKGPAGKTLAGVIGSVSAAVALFVAIPAKESGRVVEATARADGSVTVKHVAGSRHLKAYLDIVRVPTACDGVTRGVKMGDVFTPAQCDAMNEAEIIRHAEPIIACVPALYGRGNQAIAAVSLAYNIGTGGFCRSTIARLWNAGQWRAGCDFFLRYSRAGGVVVKGLAKRREWERSICLRGLPA